MRAIRLTALLGFASLSYPALTDTRLVEAVKSGDRAAALAMLREHINVNVPEIDGTTALHWAAHQDDLDLVARLLSAGAKAEVTNRYGVTPLWEAAVSGNAAMIETLLKAGADANTPNSDGETALMVVARTSSVASAKTLLSHGADVNAKEKWRGQTALMWAAAENQPELARELIAHGAEVNARSITNDWRQVTNEPRPKYMPVGGFTPLLLAARQGSLACSQVLADAGADLNMRDMDGGGSAVMMAAINGHYDVAKFLLDKGADPNLADRWGRTALYIAVDMRTMPHSGRPAPAESDSVSSLDLVKTILDHQASVNARLTEFPPYRSLNDRGADGILTVGATPLFRAAKAGDVEVIRLLIEKGADLSLANKTGITPLMAAAGLGSRDNDSRGRFKTQAEAIESIRLCLDAGADINAVDESGQTAMHAAAFWGWNDVVTFLAGHGGKLDVKDKKGHTPVDSAMGRAGGNGFGGSRIDVHEDTAALLTKLAVH